MEMPSATVEPVTTSEILGLATWDRQRSTEELRNFVLTRTLRLPEDSEIQ